LVDILGLKNIALIFQLVRTESMKSKAALVISILLNAGLIFALVVFKPKPQPTSPQAAPELRVVTNVVVEKRTEKVEVVKPQLVKLDWRQIESDDYKAYIKNLRAIGCPEETIRDIIIADLNKLYAAKWKDSVRPPGQAKYWEPLDGSIGSDPKSVAARQSLDLERRNLIRDLLGVEGEADARKQQMTFNYLDLEDRLLDYMTEDNRKQAVAIKAWDRTEVHRIQELAASENRELTAAENAEINRIRSEANTRMKQALGEDGFFQYNMRTSLTASTLRSRLVGFAPTEGEYVGIYTEQVRLKNGLGELQKAGAAANTPEQQQLLQTQFEQNLKQQLGQQRYQEFLLTEDPTYRDIMRRAQERDLPRDQALTLVQMARELNQNRDAIMRDSTLSPQQRAEAMQALAAKYQNNNVAMQKLFSPKP
jgi:hypothetical protein